MTEQVWHFVEAGQKVGPATRADLAARYAAGSITEQTLVWTAGLSQWRALRDVRELMEYFESLRIVPPPVPQQSRATPNSYAPSGSALPHLPTGSMSPGVAWTEAVSPWRRWCARMIDLAGCGLLIGLSVPAEFVPESSVAGGWLLVLAWIPLEAILIAAWGTTPGKALLGLRMTDFSAKSRLTLGQSALRAWLVFLSGQGLGIPFATIVAQIYQFGRIRDGKPVSYDDARSRVFGSPLGAGRIVLILVVGLSILALIALGAQTGS